MGQRVAVVGAGHAGVEAARVAGEAGADVVLYSAETVWPYFRPRLVTVAFGEAEPQSIGMHPPDWYAARKITVRLNSRVDGFDAASLRLCAGGVEERFDGVVVATGATPILPPFAGVGGGRITALWNMGHALALRGRMVRGDRLVVVGGGILGIETALRAAAAGLKVTLVELAERLMPVHFGPRAAAVLMKRIADRQVLVELGRRVESAQASADGSSVRLALDGGRELAAEWCLVTIGARPDLAVGALAGLVCERGVKVDEFMRTSAAGVFAAGDIAQWAGGVRCSVRDATAKGKIAGANLIASLGGGRLTPYEPAVAPVSFKHRDFELHALGGVISSEHQELALDGSSDSVVRSLLVKDGVITGVQLVGTREGFDELTGQLGRRADEAAHA